MRVSLLLAMLFMFTIPAHARFVKGLKAKMSKFKKKCPRDKRLRFGKCVKKRGLPGKKFKPKKKMQGRPFVKNKRPSFKKRPRFLKKKKAFKFGKKGLFSKLKKKKCKKGYWNKNGKCLKRRHGRPLKRPGQMSCSAAKRKARTMRFARGGLQKYLAKYCK